MQGEVGGKSILKDFIIKHHHCEAYLKDNVKDVSASVLRPQS